MHVVFKMYFSNHLKFIEVEIHFGIHWSTIMVHIFWKDSQILRRWFLKNQRFKYYTVIIIYIEMLF